MIRIKTRKEISGQLYLTKADIRKLLNVSQASASRIYKLAEKIDTEELKEFRVEPTKVRITSVSKVTGISVNLMKKQVEEEQT